MDAEQRLRALYAAFNAHEIDTVIAALSEDVDWPNAWEGGRLRGRQAVRDYWTRQWAEIDSRADPTSFTSLPDGRIAVDVELTARGLEQTRARHVYELRDGLVTRMGVETQ
jgi:hypothetical protein